MERIHLADDQIVLHQTVIGVLGSVTLAPGDALAEYVNVPTCVYPLAPVPGGDAMFYSPCGFVGIERKRGDDAVNSWSNGHLAEQLSIMLDYYDHTVLLIEDTDGQQLYHSFVKSFERPALQFLRWQDDLMTYQEQGVTIRYSLSIKGTGLAVARLVGRYEDVTHHAFDVRIKASGSHLQRRMLEGIPGWGRETADSALRALGTPIRVLTAPVEQLEKVRLLTPRKVRIMQDAYGI